MNNFLLAIMWQGSRSQVAQPKNTIFCSQNLREKELSFQWRAERCYSCQANWPLWRQLQGSNIFNVWFLITFGFLLFSTSTNQKSLISFNTKTCP